VIETAAGILASSSNQEGQANHAGNPTEIPHESEFITAGISFDPGGIVRLGAANSAESVREEA
jgi:hypothetical protein